MRRKPDNLIPLELSILEAAAELQTLGTPCFHGFGIAKRLKDRSEARLLTAHGSLYRALDRLYRAGMLASEWEDPVIAVNERRPRRRLYRVTAAGEAALARERAGRAVQPQTRPRFAAS